MSSFNSAMANIAIQQIEKLLDLTNYSCDRINLQIGSPNVMTTGVV